MFMFFSFELGIISSFFLFIISYFYLISKSNNIL